MNKVPMKVGFVGLGNMGMPMAQRLLQAGHEVAAWNRTESRVRDFEKRGGKGARSPKLAAGSGVVITMLADDAAVESVVFGEDGIAAGLGQEGVHISMSTISIALSRRLQEMHERAGQSFIAAPVFGRPEAAEAGKLFVVAAGIATDLDRCKNVWNAMAQRTFAIETAEAWRANLVKIAGNFMLESAIQSLSQAVALTRKAGMDPHEFIEIMSNSLFTSPFYKAYGSMIAEENYEQKNGFKLRLALKDSRLALQAADLTEVPMPQASLIHDQILAAIGQGYENLDMSALGKLAADHAGLNR